MWSTNPYSRASWAENQWSRSESAMISSTVCPVLAAVISASSCFILMMRSALMRMSVAEPPAPPEGWCMSTRAWGVR